VKPGGLCSPRMTVALLSAGKRRAWRGRWGSNSAPIARRGNYSCPPPLSTAVLLWSSLHSSVFFLFSFIFEKKWHAQPTFSFCFTAQCGHTSTSTVHPPPQTIWASVRARAVWPHVSRSPSVLNSKLPLRPRQSGGGAACLLPGNFRKASGDPKRKGALRSRHVVFDGNYSAVPQTASYRSD